MTVPLRGVKTMGTETGGTVVLVGSSTKEKAEAVARRFRAFLRDLGETHGHGWQTAVAEQLGFSPSAINKVINSNRDPGVDMIASAVDAYQVSADHFFQETGIAKPSFPDTFPPTPPITTRTDALLVFDAHLLAMMAEARRAMAIIRWGDPDVAAQVMKNTSRFPAVPAELDTESAIDWCVLARKALASSPEPGPGGRVDIYSYLETLAAARREVEQELRELPIGALPRWAGWLTNAAPSVAVEEQWLRHDDQDVIAPAYASPDPAPRQTPSTPVTRRDVGSTEPDEKTG